MSGLVRSALCVIALATVTRAACTDRHLPELSFDLTGRSLVWPSDSVRTIYETSGRFVPRNVIATRMQIYKDAALVAFPRLKHGVPFTLGVVSLKNRGNCVAAVAAPWPCWDIQEEGRCDALQNAVDIVLDIQDILWVLDAGVVNTMEQPVRRCAPKVVGIDVKSGKVVKVIDLSSLVTSNSVLQQIIVDYANDGKVYLYIADARARAIIVYDVTANRGFRVILPNAVSLGGSSNGVLYIALVQKSSGTPVVYFTYLSSSRLFSIKAVHLRRGSASGSVVDVGPKEEEIVILGNDNGSALFFRKKGQSDVYMWNTETCFKPANMILVQKGNECRLPTQVVPGYKRLMWVMESNLHHYAQNTVACAGAEVNIHPLVKSCEDN